MVHERRSDHLDGPAALGLRHGADSACAFSGFEQSEPREANGLSRRARSQAKGNLAIPSNSRQLQILTEITGTRAVV
jgi:hypothetical protein